MPDLPPLSSRSRKLIEQVDTRRQQGQARTQAHIQEALRAFFAAQDDLAHIQQDDQNNPGYAELVVHIKGDRVADVYQRHGFQVEGQGGFYKATYTGTQKKEQL